MPDVLELNVFLFVAQAIGKVAHLTISMQVVLDVYFCVRSHLGTIQTMVLI